MQKKFRVLRIVATLVKLVAWIVLVLGVLGGCGILAWGLMTGGATPRSTTGDLSPVVGPWVGVISSAVGGLVIIVMALLNFVFIYAYGELIYLLLALEENTRLTAERLQEMNKK